MCLLAKVPLFTSSLDLVACLGSSIARANNKAGVLRRIQVSSRDPDRVYRKQKETLPQDHLLPPVSVDVTKRDTLTHAFDNADAVVSPQPNLRQSNGGGRRTLHWQRPLSEQS
jgi:hypothetical protein